MNLSSRISGNSGLHPRNRQSLIKSNDVQSRSRLSHRNDTHSVLTAVPRKSSGNAVSTSGSCDSATEKTRKTTVRTQEAPITWCETIIAFLEIITENISHISLDDQETKKGIIKNSLLLDVARTDNIDITILDNLTQSCSNEEEYMKREIEEKKRSKIVTLREIECSGSFTTAIEQTATVRTTNGLTTEDITIGNESLSLQTDTNVRHTKENMIQEKVIFDVHNDQIIKSDGDRAFLMIDFKTNESIQDDFQNDKDKMELKGNITIVSDKKFTQVIGEINANNITPITGVNSKMDENLEAMEREPFTESETKEIIKNIETENEIPYLNEKDEQTLVTSDEDSKYEFVEIFQDMIREIEAIESVNMEVKVYNEVRVKESVNYANQSVDTICEVEFLNMALEETVDKLLITVYAEQYASIKQHFPSCVDDKNHLRSPEPLPNNIEINEKHICSGSQTAGNVEESTCKPPENCLNAEDFSVRNKIDDNMSTCLPAHSLIKESDRIVVDSEDFMFQHKSYAQLEKSSASEDIFHGYSQTEEQQDALDLNINMKIEDKVNEPPNNSDLAGDVTSESKIDERETIEFQFNKSDSPEFGIRENNDLLVEHRTNSERPIAEYIPEIDILSYKNFDNTDYGWLNQTSSKSMSQDQNPINSMRRSPKIIAKLYSDQIFDESIPGERMSYPGRSNSDNIGYSRDLNPSSSSASDYSQQPFGKPHKEYFKRYKNYANTRQKFYLRKDNMDASSSHFPMAYGTQPDLSVHNTDMPFYEGRPYKNKRRGKRSGKSHKPKYMPS